tara:strand:- start:350 stop:1429 length:1080 start_codon:yes stop_codon:yes gene_type:complete
LTAERPGNDRLWEGIYAFYSYEFQKSVAILTEVKSNHPEHPTVHFTWAVAKWLRAQAYDGIEASYDTLLTALDTIVPTYETYVETFPEEPQYRLYFAAAKGLKARVHLGKKEWVGVVMEGIKGYGGVRSLYREHPEIYDTYFPMGILNFYAGNMSGFVRFISSFLGIEPDKELGLELMTTTAEKGEFAWIEASQILVYIYLWIEVNYDKALAISERLVERLPSSIYNQHLLTESLISHNRLNEAEEVLERTRAMADETPPVSRKGWLPTLKYQEALLAFYREDYEKAHRLVTQSIDEFNTELDTPLGYSYLLRGMINDLRGERREAVDDYRSAILLDNYTSAVREARGYLRRPYTLSVQ